MTELQRSYFIKDKYRGTTVYFQVLSELVRAAQYRGTTKFQDIAVVMGLAIAGGHRGSDVGYILNEICEDEVNANRPMLSCVVVGVAGNVGEGFSSLNTSDRSSQARNERT